MSIADVFKGAALIGFGGLEGYSFGRCGLFNPQAMRDQMLFQNMLVMKLFLSGVGSSMVLQGIMSLVHPEMFAPSRAYAQTFFGYARVIGGCSVLGLGMALAGSGPTLVPSQIGAGVGSALPTFAGCIAGALSYLTIEKVMKIEGCPQVPVGAKIVVEQRVNTSYARIAIPTGIALIGAIVALEYVWPHSSDLASINTNITNPWLPITAGLIIGLGQMPLRYISGDGQGGSKSLLNLINLGSFGQLAKGYAPKTLAAASQILYVYVGSTLGSYLATRSDPQFVAPEGVNNVRAFVGGAAMILGARYAGGCTCGHGISGFSELSIQSIIGTCAIFGGGIASTVALGL